VDNITLAKQKENFASDYRNTSGASKIAHMRMLTHYQWDYISVKRTTKALKT
jgi:hypothetical protein